MEDESEDIILEGTALHKYLEEVGYTDFEVYESQSNNVPINKNSGNKEVESSVYAVELLSEGLLVLTGLHELGKEYLELCTLSLLKEKCLEEEHMLILENLSDSFRSLNIDSHLLYPGYLEQSLCTKSFMKKCILVPFKTMCFWVILATCLVVSCMFIFGASSMDLFALWIFTMFFPFLLRLVYVIRYQSALNAFQSLLKDFRDINHASAKCLKFLNEVNIIIRGLSQKTLESEDVLELEYRESLAAEHSHLFNTVVSVIREGRSKLLKFEVLGFQNHHIYFNKHYSICEETESELDLYKKLKIERKKVVKLVSSFLTEVFLYLEYSGRPVFEVIPSRGSTMMKQSARMLLKGLDLSSKVWMKEEPKLKGTLKLRKESDRMKFDLLAAVDSLSIRCRSLAQSGVSFQKVVAECDFEGAERRSLEGIKGLCEEVKKEIIFCKACLDDVEDKVEVMNSAPSKNKDHPVVTSEEGIGEGEEEPSTDRRVLLELKDHTIEDEVFEAMVDRKKDCRNVGADEHWFVDLKKERKLKKRQKESCKRVLMEIKPILQKRREVWREREEKALRRMGLTPETKNKDSPTEPSLSGDSGTSSPVEFGSIVGVGKTSGSGRSAISEDEKKDEFSQRIISTSGEEYDSEEERLLLYRRVKKELDEDEALRQKTEIESEESDSSTSSDTLRKKCRFSLPLSPSNDFKTSRFTEGVKESADPSQVNVCASSDALLNVSNIIKGKEVWGWDNSGESNEFRGEENYPLISRTDPMSLVPSVISGRRDSGSDSPGKNLCLDPRSLKEEGEERFQNRESFSCGNSSDEGEKGLLDWSSCIGFGSVRMISEEGSRALGFPSVVSSKFFGTSTAGKEEVFGGVGECDSEHDQDGNSDENINV